MYLKRETQHRGGGRGGGTRGIKKMEDVGFVCGQDFVHRQRRSEWVYTKTPLRLTHVAKTHLEFVSRCNEKKKWGEGGGGETVVGAEEAIGSDQPAQQKKASCQRLIQKMTMQIRRRE